MTFCTGCGKEIPANAQFCPGCGKKAVATQTDLQQIKTESPKGLLDVSKVMESGAKSEGRQWSYAGIACALLTFILPPYYMMILAIILGAVGVSKKDNLGYYAIAGGIILAILNDRIMTPMIRGW